jgi:hypothetical protein
MFVNIINSYRYVVAICDKELIGKKFEEEDFQLDIKESFYKGKIKSEQEIIKIIKDMSAEDATFNIVGKNAVNTAIKTGIISKNSVKKIQNIPYAMVLL